MNSLCESTGFFLEITDDRFKEIYFLRDTEQKYFNSIQDICEDESGNTANNYQNNKDNMHRLLTVKLITSTIDTITALPDDSACGECGTGTELAFIPPIGFKLASMVKKRKKRWVAFVKLLIAKIFGS